MTNTTENKTNQISNQVPASQGILKPSDVIDIFELFSIFRRHWLIFALLSVIGLVAGVTYAR